MGAKLRISNETGACFGKINTKVGEKELNSKKNVVSQHTLRGHVQCFLSFSQNCEAAAVLTYDDEIVVLLSTLNEQVFAAEELFFGDGGIGVGELLLVDAQGSALREFTDFAL